MKSNRLAIPCIVALVLTASTPVWAQSPDAEDPGEKPLSTSQDHSVDTQSEPSGFVRREMDDGVSEEQRQTDQQDQPSVHSMDPEPIAPSPTPAVSSPDQDAPAAEPNPATTAEMTSQREDGSKASLKLLTWGGAYRAGLDEAVIKSFDAQRNTRVDILEHEMSRGKELSALAASELNPDIVELGGAALFEGCEANRLARLDTLALAPAAAEITADEDYLPGGLQPCGVATYAWSSLVGVNTKVVEKKVPKMLAHVFDAKSYGGKRAFVKSPKFVLEMALLADKVKAEKIYETLESDEGVDRAFKKLARLKKSLVWVDTALDAMQMLRQGKVAMAQVFSGRAAQAIVRGASLNLIWDRQIYVVNYLAIPASTKNLKTSREFIAFATAPRQMADFASLFPYGPMRSSAVTQVDTHKRVKVSLSGVLPTSPKNLKTAFRMDEAWWSKNEDRLKAKFETWLSDQAAKPAKKNSNR